MKQIATLPFKVKAENPEQDFSWTTNQSVQKLLDVVAHILANEYVRAVKENPILFTKIASAASLPRKDGSELI